MWFLRKKIYCFADQEKEIVTEEERPDRKPHNPWAANGRWPGHIIHPFFISLWQVSAVRAIW